MLALELNDAMLLLAAPAESGGARIVARAPGVAGFVAGAVVTGVSAAAMQRRQPLLAYHRYWQDLSSEPLGRTHQPQLSAADLAFEQLRSLLRAAADAEAGESADGRKLLLAVPAGYSREQLGLLLGIAAEAGAGETGLVDAALVACAHSAVPAHVLHLELYRHRAVLTAIEQDGAGARRARSEFDAQCGLQRLQQLCIDTIAAQFVRHTRYDPLHHADSEQALADGVDAWLQELAQSEAVPVPLTVNGAPLQVEYTRAQWLAAAEPVYAALLQLAQRTRPAGQHIELRVGARAQSLPGLMDRLQSLGACDVSPLPEAAGAHGALLYAGQILRGAEPALVCQLPLATSSGSSAGELRPGRTAAAGAAATHVMYGDRIWALGIEPLLVGTAVPAGERALDLPAGLPGVSRLHCRLTRRDGVACVEDLSTYGSYVNDERVHGRTALQRGDRLRLGTPGVQLDLVELAG